MLCFSILRDAPSMTCARSDMLVVVSGAVELAGSGGGAWCSYSCGGDAGGHPGPRPMGRPSTTEWQRLDAPLGGRGTRVHAPWADPLPPSGSGLMPQA